ncbi:winged helix-turn-helix domain-containing protein, partial [Streptomyces sp. NPDC127574]
VAKQVTVDGVRAVPAVAQALVEAASWVDCTDVRVERVDAPQLRDALDSEIRRLLG